MNNYSCILSPTEIKHLQRLLEPYETVANGDGIVNFYKYQNVAITVYKNNLVRFQGQSVIQVVNKVFSQIRNQHSSKITSGENETDKIKVVDDDDPKQFEKALKIIETTQKKYVAYAPNLKKLSRILAFRFIYLMSKKDLSSHELIVVTTTKKEKELIKREIVSLLPHADFSFDPYFLTLYAFCLRLLNNNLRVLGYKNEFKWLSDAEKEFAVKDICKKIGLTEEELCKRITEINNFQKVHNLTIEEALKRGWPDKDWVSFKEKIVAFNDEYNRRCLESGELDFNDMLILARNALRKYPAIKLEFPQKILFGDSGWMNELEYEMLSLIAEKATNFFIVHLDHQNHEHDEVVEEIHTPTNFLRSLEKRTLVRDKRLSQDANFINPLLKGFLRQRYNEGCLEKIKQTDHYAKSRKHSVSSNNNSEATMVPWFKSKALSEDELIEIGCDEVGVGDYFGGIVTAAVALQPGQLDKLPLDSIKDSKLLTNEQIVDLYKQLKRSVRFSVTELTPSQYNRLYDDYHNANIIKVYAHNKALINLIDQKRIDLKKACIVMDQFSKPSYYKQYLDKIQSAQKIKINLFKTHAETEYVSVALASIFARYHFLEQIKKMQKKSSILIPLGASDPKVKTNAEKIYKQHGIEGLKQFVKFHFNFTESIVKTHPTKKLFSK